MSRIDTFGSTKTVHLWPVTLLRVYTGVFFLYYGFGKLTGGNFADGMEGFIRGNLEHSFGFMREFLESVVLPHKVLFATVVSWGEFLLGLALIVGLATRWVSLAGALMVACFWFTKGQGFLAAQNHDAIWFMILLVLAAMHAGRAYGLDQRLAARFRFLA